MHSDLRLCRQKLMNCSCTTKNHLLREILRDLNLIIIQGYYSPLSRQKNYRLSQTFLDEIAKQYVEQMLGEHQVRKLNLNTNKVQVSNFPDYNNFLTFLRLFFPQLSLIDRQKENRQPTIQIHFAYLLTYLSRR